MMSSPRCKKNPQRERKKKLLIKKIFVHLLIIIIIFFLMYVTNICRNYSTKQRVNAKLNLFFLHVIVQYVCCILLLCWYTCNQSYIEQFFNLHISIYIHLPLTQKALKTKLTWNTCNLSSICYLFTSWKWVDIISFAWLDFT